MPVIKQSKIQQGTFQIACKICEHPEARIVHNILTRHFGKQGQDLLAKRGLKPIENLKSVSVPRGDEDVEAEIINQGNGRFCYWADGWMEISQHDIQQYQLDLEWMLRWIKSSLNLPANNVVKTLAEERIWSLGDIRLRDKKAHVIFVRRPRSKEVMKSLNDNLKEKYHHKPILIVTTSPHIESFSLPGNSYIAYIGDLITNDRFLKFDVETIHSKMFGQAVSGAFSTGFRTAFFNGMQFSFSKLQAAIVETLHSHGAPMHKTEFMSLHSRQDDPKHAFRSNGKYHPAWGTLIQFDKQGNYWLAA